MKIIATSDWHLGNMFHGNDRLPEHQHFLSWLLSQIEEQQPDALLIAGDVFDNGNPSAASQSAYYGFLADAGERCPTMQIVITAGNHDSAAKHTVSKVLWETQNVHMVSYLTDGPVIEVPGKGWIAAVPYINERSMPEGLFQTILDDIAGL